MFCTGNGAFSSVTCSGDSGGPFAVKNSSGKWELVGVTSFVNIWPSRCDSYSGFTEVAAFRPWVTQEISKPRAPTPPKASIRCGSARGSAVVTWTKGSPGIPATYKAFKIYDSYGTLVGTAKGTASSYQINSLAAKRDYTFWVKAENSTGLSRKSNNVSVRCD
jgi:secreted trypsin-like serine protease